MNRSERRKMSKKLGIMEYQKELPRNKKFELMRENIISGKQQHKQFTEEVKRLQNLTQEERDAEYIQLLAEDIAKKEKIDVINAFEKAQKMYYKKLR